MHSLHFDHVLPVSFEISQIKDFWLVSDDVIIHSTIKCIFISLKSARVFKCMLNNQDKMLQDALALFQTRMYFSFLTYKLQNLTIDYIPHTLYKYLVHGTCSKNVSTI